MRWEAMSDIPADYRERLDLREQMARLDQLREEALKLAAEQHKLTAEAGKLIAEAAKLKWDRSSITYGDEQGTVQHADGGGPPRGIGSGGGRGRSAGLLRGHSGASEVAGGSRLHRQAGRALCPMSDDVLGQILERLTSLETGQTRGCAPI
jgi:hypothetical protein